MTITKDLFDRAQQIYRHQCHSNEVYANFIASLGRDFNEVNSISEIPYLPISAFKHHAVKSGTWTPELVYTSSGTGGIQSRHFINNNEEYLRNCVDGFESFYGDIFDYTFVCLLPGYLERKGSSLITMLKHFMDQSERSLSGFYLNEFDLVYKVLNRCKENKDKTILWGVTYALLDFGEVYDMDWKELIVLETGGMKGKRQEMPKSALHQQLSNLYGVSCIHSEYGMTELLSQAYSVCDGRFKPSDTMHVHCRSIDDPFQVMPYGKTGILHIFDEKNYNTCSFIATEDLGRVYSDGSFEILGRLDNSDVRGCNLLIDEMER